MIKGNWYKNPHETYAWRIATHDGQEYRLFRVFGGRDPGWWLSGPGCPKEGRWVGSNLDEAKFAAEGFIDKWTSK